MPALPSLLRSLTPSALMAVALIACGANGRGPATVAPGADGGSTDPDAGTTDASSAGGACRSAADCRAFSDYCTGCNCDALGTSDPDPACTGPGVRCLMDPCQGRAAACDATGHCVVEPRH